MTDSTVPLAAIALVGSILALVVTPLFSLLRANTKALEKLVASSEKVAHATQRGADEAKERNGHLGEQSLHLASLVSAGNQDMKAVKDILSKSAIIAAEDRDILTGGPQVVTEQHVEHQHIENVIKE